MRTTPSKKIKWSERMIARALAVQVFQKKHLVICPNCTWTGDELDLLVVTPDLRIVDVEVKISRADLKADVKKDKWMFPLSYEQRYQRRMNARLGKPVEQLPRREWPRSVWKHYYAMPADIWTAELAASIPANSGVITLMQFGTGILAKIIRRAKPYRDATTISPADAVNLARLTSLRMWDAYAELAKLKEDG